MCPACAATLAMVVGGAVSTGALGIVLAKGAGSKTGRIQPDSARQTESQVTNEERRHDGNRGN